MTTTLTNNEVQAAIIAFLKSISSISTEVNSGLEIREDQWGGLDFTYPNIRVQLERLVPNINNCGYDEVMFNILVFSEEPSSLSCDRIAGVVRNQMLSSFNKNSIRFFSVHIQEVIPAFRYSEITWQSQVKIKAYLSQIP